ncbi:MAG: flagellar basal body P-ring formation chaperone FlgA [Candidatus Margulisbacteria bacterium]|nr:flagellar basal body P-ring formation chaperone FlgA [Candidatus Margulisiibacteriota bacterium]MBU1021482.1 flagellar basal body P-ring formation chaperone FlgA [Candidatus Margulisiibacteriota bacterium]MBU1728567.1 flagellar basal body P-ring formation chaperone FlgA [Candidatus Margulisiibacteriota bacterium]MBU1955854.1 flagellar basal body P-ring formation chaperone FlgA [Candidatus Margulisiibacteriota bacterium]
MKKILLSILTINLVLLIGVVPAVASVAQIENKVNSAVYSYIIGKYPHLKNDEIKISFKYADKSFAALADESAELSFKVLELYPNFKPAGETLMPLQVYKNDKEYKRIFVKTIVEVYRTVVVATRQLKKYDIIQAADLAYSKLDIMTNSIEYFTEKEGLIGKQTKTIIRKGKPFFSWMLREVPLFSRGAEVKIKVIRGNVTIFAKGRAYGDGYLGKKVKVKRLDSKKEFIATVIGENEVEVN